LIFSIQTDRMEIKPTVMSMGKALNKMPHLRVIRQDVNLSRLAA